MKELSIEQKAQRYDEALQRTRRWYDSNTNEGYRAIFEEIFPELKESEDESIRKGLIKFVSAVMRGNDDAELSGVLAKDCLAWLEKQGEQEPAWSDYDRDMLDNLIEDEYCPLDSEYISWFKDIKERFDNI